MCRTASDLPGPGWGCLSEQATLRWRLFLQGLVVIPPQFKHLRKKATHMFGVAWCDECEWEGQVAHVHDAAALHALGTGHTVRFECSTQVELSMQPLHIPSQRQPLG